MLRFNAEAARDVSTFIFHLAQAVEENVADSLTVRFKAGRHRRVVPTPVHVREERHGGEACPSPSTASRHVRGARGGGRGIAGRGVFAVRCGEWRCTGRAVGKGREEDARTIPPNSARKGDVNMKVGIASSYTFFFWIAWIIVSAAIAAVTAGLGLILLLPLFWHKRAVVNRNRLLFEPGSNNITCEHGRWFVKDDDLVPISAIDNVKLDRSLLGKIFGWCVITIETRSESYSLSHVSTNEAEAFRKAILSAK